MELRTTENHVGGWGRRTVLVVGQTEFGQAVREYLERGGYTISGFATHIGVTPSTLTTWLDKSYSKPENVFLIEQRLTLPPGALSRHLGFLPVDAVPAVDVRDALALDADLTEDQREVVEALWLQMRAQTRARRLQRSQPGGR